MPTAKGQDHRSRLTHGERLDTRMNGHRHTVVTVVLLETLGNPVIDLYCDEDWTLCESDERLPFGSLPG